MKTKITPFWKERLLLLTLLLIGAGLRLWDVGRVPPGLYHDEAQHGLDALDVLSGNPSFYFTTNNGREPLFIYLVTASVAILGRSPLAIRLPSFFVGFLTLAATYDLARVLWGRRAGRWALGILAVTFWHVHLSRVGFRAVLLPLFTALTLAQLARGLRAQSAGSPRPRHWIAGGIFYGISWYTYMAARFTPIALVVMLIYGWIYHREITRRSWRGALYFCAAALIVLAPLGLYTLQYPDIVLSRTGQVTITHPEINDGDFWGTLLQHTLRTAGMFFMRGDRIWRHNLAWRPVWGPALGLAFVIGLGAALARFRHDAGSALTLLWTATMALPTLLAEDAPHFLRAVGVLPTAMLLPTLGLMWIEASGKRQAASGRKLVSCVLHPVSCVLHPASCILLLAFCFTTYDYFVRFANAPLTYHWFEGGQVALASEINTLNGQGWGGQQMLPGPRTGRTVYIDQPLWESWSALPFLTPADHIRFLSPAVAPDANPALSFIVWPYRDWQHDVFSHIPRPAYLQVIEGPQIQGDKDAQPLTVARIIHADPVPAIPAPIAHFAGGIRLHAALVRSHGTVRLWWQTDMVQTAPTTVFVHYLRDGNIIAQHDAQPGDGHLPTTLWIPGDLILDAHPFPNITLDPTRDRLHIGLYDSATIEGLPRVDVDGNIIGDWIDVGVIVEP